MDDNCRIRAFFVSFFMAGSNYYMNIAQLIQDTAQPVILCYAPG